MYIASHEHNHPSNVASIYQVWSGNVYDVILGDILLINVTFSVYGS